MSRLNFYERAAKLGHSIEDLKAGKEVSSTIDVSNVDDLRNLLDDGCDLQQRAQRDLLLFGPMPVNPPTSTVIDNSDAAIMRRVHGFLYGNTELLPSDREIIKNSFPVHVAASSLENYTYDVPTNIGTSLPIVIKNYATVTINNGACVNVYNSELQYTMDTLIRNGTPPAGFGDFNILGVNGTTGTTGPAGTDQGKATKGTNGNCSSCGIASDAGKTGDTGKPGGEGKPGGRGNDGLPSRAATITINTDIQSSNTIVIYTASGAGGKGGTGGAGGKGGDGGDGGTGATCSATGSAGGNGGAGASGGVGGDGGPGGNGVDKQNDILVYVPTAIIGKVTQASSDAPGGAGGDGGTGGAKGVGGTGGTGGPYNSSGTKGDDGGKGGDGATGPKSNVSGKPAAIQIRPL